ncbi:MAG: serine/threonine-protein kinase [Acidobacteriota bacterium]
MIPHDSDNRLESEALEAFDRALDLAGDERERFLGSLTTSVSERVRSLLLATDGPCLLDDGAAAAAPQLLDELAAGEGGPAQVGRRVGAYVVTELLGQGGMGRVYEAHRADGQFEQTVALKVLRWDIEDAEARARFLRERQTLADLSHPLIPQLLDGGVTEDGLPYLVLEKVEGEPIDAYCEKERLDLGQRLDLFARVCRVVEAAHRQLVIHRDIKPSNILVNDDGNPVLLDFGIAKLLALDGPSELEEQTLTRTALTPRFAAPEQINGHRITLGTDVYSLASLLHHLLLGAPIHSADDPTLGELLRRVTETETPRPSGQARALTTVPAGLETPAVLERSLRGDLDAILTKASATDPQDRYATAGLLADDVERFLRHEPIRARPAGLMLRLRKSARRQWKLAVALGLLGIAIVAGTVSTLWQARRAVAEAEVATRESARANDVTALMTEIFDSEVLEGEAPVETAKTLLDRGAQRAELQLEDQPELLVDFLVSLAESYDHLELHQESSATRDRARAVEEATDAPRVELLIRMAAEGAASENQGYGWAKAVRWAEYGQELIEQHPEVETGPLTALLRLEHAIGLIELRKLRRARELLESAEPRLRKLSLEDSDHLLRLNVALAKLARATGNFVEAERYYRLNLEAAVEAAGDGDGIEGSYYNNVAVMLREQGRLQEAEDFYLKALGATNRDLGPTSRPSLTVLGNLIVVKTRLGKTEEMLELSRQLLELSLQVYPEGSWRRAVAIENRSAELAISDRIDEALQLQGQAVGGFERSIGPDHAWTLTARAMLALLEWLGGEEAAKNRLDILLEDFRRRELDATEIQRLSFLTKTLRAHDQSEFAATLEETMKARLASLDQAEEAL